VDTYRDGDGFAALGDPTRRAIIACLAEGPRAVVDLAATLPISRPAVSQHLKILKDAGLVSERALGTRRIYRLNPTAVAALRDQLDTFWSRALASYADVVAPATETDIDQRDVAQNVSAADAALHQSSEETP
jgi:DNA-binding transcriptional ArsR family regulator